LKRPLLWMGAVFVVLFALVALFRFRGRDGGGDASSRADAETIRTFWETYNRGTDARLAGDYERAAAAYRDALAIDPNHQDSRFYLATSLEALGRYPEAVTVLRELTALYPEHSRAWSHLGAVLATKAPGAVPDLDAAEAAFVRAQAINSEHTGPFVSRGQIALERGDLDRAAELFRIAADAGSPEGAFLAGLTAYLGGDLATASTFFHEVLDRSAREAAITGRGASSEGDIEGELTPLDRARIRSEKFLSWMNLEVKDSRVALAAGADADGRGAWVDLDGDGTESLVVAAADGLHLPEGRIDVGPCWDVVPLDADGDGWMDLYVLGSGYTGTGRNTLLRNGRGELADVTAQWGLTGERATSRAVSADLDGDGHVDLLEVGNAVENATPVRLYLQRGGRFELADRGLNYDAHAVDAAVADVDADGRDDVFVLGWKAPGRLFRNTGERFEDVTGSAGLSSVGGDGFSALFFDFDADGDQDLLVTAHAAHELSLVRSTRGPTPRFFRNDGRGHFTEGTSAVGLDKSFGVMHAVAADLDRDGFSDVVLALGGLDISHLEPSVVLRNERGEKLVPWALLPSRNEPHNAMGVAVSGADVFLSGVGVFRSSLR